jgi:hypothetical protein
MSWAGSKKVAIEELVSDLDSTNRTLEIVVNEIRGNRKRSAPKITPSVPFEDARAIQLAYTHLYEALTSACSDCDCSTHCIDLALEYGESTQSGDSFKSTPSDYKVVFHVGSSKCWHISLTYAEVPARVTTFPKPSEGDLDVCSRPLKSALAKTGGGGTQPGRSSKIVGFTVPHHATSTSEWSGNTPHASFPSESYQLQSQNQQRLIRNLCAHLKGRESVQQQVRDYQQSLGYVGEYKKCLYEVHLSGGDADHPEPSQSLNQILAGSPTYERMTKIMMRPYQRWKLAYVLALFLLRLYSSPWLREHDRWASSDIRFFPILPAQEGTSPVVPHLTASRKANKDPNQLVSAIVKNYQIYALGVVLLEIALGKSIDTSKVCSNDGHEMKEYHAVMKLDKEGAAGQELGPQYGDIVSRCLHFKFDTEEQDLTGVKLQRSFYNDVVCQLEGCLKCLERGH